jgi:hypothetical protein
MARADRINRGELPRLVTHAFKVGFSPPLTVRAQVSQLEALGVGAFIEAVDMRDIQAAIDNSGHTDITQTYENLLRGSRNHLRAFVRTIENLGVVYEAQVLPQSDVDAIVDSPIERGGS